jgi:hypothetical protein
MEGNDQSNAPARAGETRRIGATMFRDYAGVMVCSITVLSFISIGFLIMFVKVVGGGDASPPGEWLAAMLSLASTALGFLAGQKSESMKSNHTEELKSNRCPCANHRDPPV